MTISSLNHGDVPDHDHVAEGEDRRSQTAILVSVILCVQYCVLVDL